jgi:ubiquitin-like protein Pup
MTPTGNASVGVFAFWGGVVMADQERKSAQRTAPKEDERTTTPKSTVTEKGEKLKKTMDDILDEIDAVLEKNAEEFVKSYVQRGGE